MTTITINKLLLEQVQDLLYRVTRWKGENHEVLTDLHDIKEAVKAVLAAPATAPDEIEQLRKDAERYQWLAEYLVSDDESYDDAIVAATTVKEVDSVIDNAMKGTS